MVTDVRRDHSFRLPRPDLSSVYGTPNACNQCHSDKPTQWAAGTITKWYGANSRRELHFVEALDAGRRGSPDAEKLLTSLIKDSSKPAIARATALSLIPRYLSATSLAAIQDSLNDNDALVRGIAVRALEPLPQNLRAQLAAPFLNDPVRFVRIETARLLAGTAPELIPPSQKTALDSAITERIESEMASAERPESHMNLALLYTQMGRMKDAESELHTALALDPSYVPALVNLADLYRVQQRETEAGQLLERAIAIAPDAAEPVHALGLLKTRLGQKQEALALLARAVQLQPHTTRYAYVYGVALHSYGEVDKAVALLKQTQDTHPTDRDVLLALITFLRDKGDLPSATNYANKLVQLSPGNTQAIALRNSLNPTK
jgi:tetratricopeptide (TPR) repeat protein